MILFWHLKVMYDSEDPTAIFYLAGTNNVGNLLEVTTLKSWEMCQCKTTLHYRSSRVGPLGKLFENVRHLLKLSVYQRQIRVIFGNIYLDHGRFICTLFSEAACCYEVAWWAAKNRADQGKRSPSPSLCYQNTQAFLVLTRTLKQVMFCCI